MPASLEFLQPLQQWSWHDLEFRSATTKAAIRKRVRLPRGPAEEQAKGVAPPERVVGRLRIREMQLDSRLVEELLPSTRVEDVVIETARASLGDFGLDDVKFSRCTFFEQDFQAGTFRNVRFHHCTFLGVTFGHCAFRNVEFENCDFIACRFESCDFENTTFSDHVVEDTILTGQDLRGSSLTNVLFRQCILHQVDFRGVIARDILVSASCDLADVWIAGFQGGFFIRFQHGFRRDKGVRVDPSEQPSFQERRWLWKRTIGLALFKVNVLDSIQTLAASIAFCGAVWIILDTLAEALGISAQHIIMTLSAIVASFGVALIAATYAREVDTRRMVLRQARVLGLRPSRYAW